MTYQEEIEVLEQNLEFWEGKKEEVEDMISKIKLRIAKLKAAQQGVQPTAAGGSDSGENSESGGG